MKFTYSVIETPENCVKSVERHQNDSNKFVQISHVILVFPLVTVKKQKPLEQARYYVTCHFRKATLPII